MRFLTVSWWCPILCIIYTNTTLNVLESKNDQNVPIPWAKRFFYVSSSLTLWNLEFFVQHTNPCQSLSFSSPWPSHWFLRINLSNAAGDLAIIGKIRKLFLCFKSLHQSRCPLKMGPRTTTTQLMCCLPSSLSLQRVSFANTHPGADRAPFSLLFPELAVKVLTTSLQLWQWVSFPLVINISKGICGPHIVIHA